MPHVVKMYYLRTHVAGDALDQIKGKPITEKSYQDAWDMLVKYHENKRRLVSAHMADFYSVKAMKAETSSELKRLLFVTVNRLKTSVRQDWKKIPRLRKCLQPQTLTLESIKADNRASAYTAKPINLINRLPKYLINNQIVKTLMETLKIHPWCIHWKYLATIRKKSKLGVPFINNPIISPVVINSKQTLFRNIWTLHQTTICVQILLVSTPSTIISLKSDA